MSNEEIGAALATAIFCAFVFVIVVVGFGWTMYRIFRSNPHKSFPTGPTGSTGPMGEYGLPGSIGVAGVSGPTGSPNYGTTTQYVTGPPNNFEKL